jgi:hypothetical protein
MYRLAVSSNSRAIPTPRQEGLTEIPDWVDHLTSWSGAYFDDAKIASDETIRSRQGSKNGCDARASGEARRKNRRAETTGDAATQPATAFTSGALRDMEAGRGEGEIQRSRQARP